MYSKKNNKIFDGYFESSFKHSNILGKSEYERASKEYELIYGKIMPKNRSAKILDVGCGVGHFLYHLDRMGYDNFVGIDISREQVDFCEKNVSAKIKLADAFEFLQNEDEGYAAIVAHDFLEHLPKDKTMAFLELVYKALVDKGLFIIRVPNMSNPFSLDSRYRDFTHETGFTEKNLYQVLWIAGFRDIQIFSSKIQIRSFRNRVRSFLVRLFHTLIRFLYYIQDFSVPNNLGKNLIAICRK